VCLFSLIQFGSLTVVADPTVIPSVVTSQVSVRVVPDQRLEDISRSLCDFLKESFKGLGSSNKFEVCMCAVQRHHETDGL
jgi:hypothetical protein